VWNYGDAQRTKASAQPSSTLAQSAYDLLLGMRSVAVTVLFLDLTNPDRPVSEVPGFVETVTTSCIIVGLTSPLPTLSERTRFGVEVMAGSGILRFQSLPHTPPEEGAQRVHLTLPRQIESVQRRKFSRVALTTAVAFSAMPDGPGAQQQSGIGQSCDLSAGGLRFTTPAPVGYGQVLSLGFNTPDGMSYRNVQGKVVRVQPGGSRQNVAVTFQNLSAEEEDQLVHTVFKLQLKSLAKQ
jgi:hypothetical protein